MECLEILPGRWCVRVPLELGVNSKKVLVGSPNSAAIRGRSIRLGGWACVRTKGVTLHSTLVLSCSDAGRAKYAHSSGSLGDAEQSASTCPHRFPIVPCAAWLGAAMRMHGISNQVLRWKAKVVGDGVAGILGDRPMLTCPLVRK